MADETKTAMEEQAKQALQTLVDIAHAGLSEPSEDVTYALETLAELTGSDIDTVTGILDSNPNNQSLTDIFIEKYPEIIPIISNEIEFNAAVENTFVEIFTAAREGKTQAFQNLSVLTGYEPDMLTNIFDALTKARAGNDDAIQYFVEATGLDAKQVAEIVANDANAAGLLFSEQTYALIATELEASLSDQATQSDIPVRPPSVEISSDLLKEFLGYQLPEDQPELQARLDNILESFTARDFDRPNEAQDAIMDIVSELEDLDLNDQAYSLELFADTLRYFSMMNSHIDQGDWNEITNVINDMKANLNHLETSDDGEILPFEGDVNALDSDNQVELAHDMALAQIAAFLDDAVDAKIAQAGFDDEYEGADLEQLKTWTEANAKGLSNYDPSIFAGELTEEALLTNESFLEAAEILYDLKAGQEGAFKDYVDSRNAKYESASERRRDRHGLRHFGEDDAKEYLGEWALQYTSDLSMNVAEGLNTKFSIDDWTKEQQTAMLYVLRAYEHKNMSLAGVGRAVSSMATDEVTWSVAGAGFVAGLFTGGTGWLAGAGGVLSRVGAQATSRVGSTLLVRQLSNSVLGKILTSNVTRGVLHAGAIGGAEGLTTDRLVNYDFERTASETINVDLQYGLGRGFMSFGGGAAFGGVFGGLGALARKWHDAKLGRQPESPDILAESAASDSLITPSPEMAMSNLSGLTPPPAAEVSPLAMSAILDTPTTTARLELPDALTTPDVDPTVLVDTAAPDAPIDKAALTAAINNVRTSLRSLADSAVSIVMPTMQRFARDEEGAIDFNLFGLRKKRKPEAEADTKGVDAKASGAEDNAEPNVETDVNSNDKADENTHKHTRDNNDTVKAAEKPRTENLTPEQIKADNQFNMFLANAKTLVKDAAERMEDAGTKDRVDIKDALREELNALKGKVQRARLLKNHANGPSIVNTLIDQIDDLRDEMLHVESGLRTSRTRRQTRGTENTQRENENTASAEAESEEPRASVDEVGTSINHRPPLNDEKSWVHGQDPNYKEDGYASATNDLDSGLAIGEIDPNLPFRRVRKKVAPSLDRSSDPILGKVKTKEGKDEFGDNVKNVVSGVYRSLEHFQTGFEDGTKRFIDALETANGDPIKIQHALDDYTLTLDKMDAATDILDVARPGITLRNATRRDYDGALSSKKNVPNITEIQKIAIQEQIIDARLLAQKMQTMALKPDGKNQINSFLQGVAQRVNRSGAQLGQFDTLIASGWEAHVGKRNGVPKKLDENGKSIKDPNGNGKTPLYKIGHTVMREKNRLGYDIAEGANAYTLGNHMLRDAKDPNIENKGTAILRDIIKEFQESTQPNETRIDSAAKKIVDGISNNQLHDLLYYLQRGAWMATKSHTNVFEKQFSSILRVVKDTLEENGPLTAYEMGALKRLEVEVNSILNDNPAGQLSVAELRFFNLAHDGKPISGRELRQRVANADINNDLTGGRYYNDLNGKPSDAARGVIGANFNRWVYDWIIDYGFRLKDVDQEATFKSREESITNWRYQFDENSQNWYGNWRFGNPLSFSGMKTNLSTAGRVYERWFTPVGLVTGSIKYAPDNTPLLNTKFGKYLRTPHVMNSIRYGSHALWAGGAYATSGMLLTSPLAPFGLLYQGTGAIASAQAAYLHNNISWGYLSSLEDSLNDTNTSGASSTSKESSSSADSTDDTITVDPNDPRQSAIRAWVDANREQLDLPTNFNPLSNEYVDSIIARAAKIWKDNPDTYPESSYPLNVPGEELPLRNLWDTARTEEDSVRREANVTEALVLAYRDVYNLDDETDPRNTEGFHFDTVLDWLLGDTADTAGGNAIGDDPWGNLFDSNQRELLKERTKYYEKAINDRPKRHATALAALEADQKAKALVIPNNATPKDIEAAIIATTNTLADARKDNGNFYTVDELKGDETKDLRRDTFAEKIDGIIDARLEAKRIEEARPAAIAAVDKWIEENDTPRFDQLAGLGTYQKDIKDGMVEALLSNQQPRFTKDDFETGKVEDKVYQELLKADVDKAFAALDTNKDGNLSQDEKDAGTKKDTDDDSPGIFDNFTPDKVKRSTANLLNSAGDIDRDGIMDDWVRATAGTIGSVVKPIGSYMGAMAADKEGQYALSIAGGIAGMLLLPGFAKSLPILKHIANIPVVGGLAFAVLGFFAAAHLTGGITRGVFTDGDTDGDAEGDAQGDGKFIQKSGAGFNVKIQDHDGSIPQIMPITDDLDEDPETTLNLFDADGDGIYVAQLFDADGNVSWSSPEMIKGEDISSSFSFTPNAFMSNADVKNGADVTLEATTHKGQDAFKLTIGTQEYYLDHRLDGELDTDNLVKLEQ